MLSKEEILEKFKKCNDERTRLEVAYKTASTEASRYYIEIEIAFNNGQMNIIRELIE